MTEVSNPPSSGPSVSHGGWQTARRLLLIVAAVATLLAVFYTEENWRGRRAWENTRHELESRGEVLDWAAYIPAPVPDSQNFFKAPNMREWFIKAPAPAAPPSTATNEATPFSPPQDNQHQEIDLVLAEVKLVTGTAPPDSQAVVVQLGDPAARKQVAKLLEDAVGPYLIGPNRGIVLARAVNQYKPLQIVLEAESAPGLKELVAHSPDRAMVEVMHNYFPTQLAMLSSSASREKPYLGYEPGGSGLFRVILKKPVYGAADYLSWTDSLKPDFELVRQALQRPYARIDCDYRRPFEINVPNFIHLRKAVQVLSQRAQCYLLLGQPDQALNELTLVNDLSQILLAKPSGKPITLVGAMIYVAIQGLSAEIIRNGLELHAWQEPQLLALEQELKSVNLLGPVAQALREERAGTSCTIETTKRGELVGLFAFEGFAKLALRVMPRGWYYQNMVAGAQMEQEALNPLDPTNQLVHPRPVANLVGELSSWSARHSPYRFLSAAAIPNFAKALETAAANQTRINQAYIACALEKFHAAQGRYPGTLQELAPAYMDKFPHDLIGGQPMKYHPDPRGGYLLYSVGWDETDNGGVPGASRDEGDWVWAMR